MNSLDATQPAIASREISSRCAAWSDNQVGSGMLLKSETPPDICASIIAIENKADESFTNLEIYSFPKGIASWAVLVFMVLETERLRQKFGYKNYDAVLINLGRRGTSVLRWIEKYGSVVQTQTDKYHFTGSLYKAAQQAMEIAGNYEAFELCYPMWHCNKFQAEYLSMSAVRFSSEWSEPAKRVSAFLKGFGQWHAIATGAESKAGIGLTNEQVRLRDNALSSCSDHAITYPEPTELLRSLFTAQLSRMRGMFRRSRSLSLGHYTFDEFMHFYAALCTVCAVHEDLHFRFWQKHKTYPTDSCVLVKTREEWTKQLANIAGINAPKCAEMIDDLTLNDIYRDLHVHPFILVNSNGLAVAPQFPLASNAEENILRILSLRRKGVFNNLIAQKEDEMLQDLMQAIPGNYLKRHRIKLPDSLPDIDVLIADESSDAVMIAEMKWLRKPAGHWKERIDREKDFTRGVEQLSKIKKFLEQRPSFLSQYKLLSKPLNQYRTKAFALIARDFLLWPECDDLILIDYDVFKSILNAGNNLAASMANFQRYAWLPVKGQDFRVSFERVGLNGVMIECENYYRI